MAELLALLVSYYGKPTPLRQLASAVEGDKWIEVTLRDVNAKGDVRKALEDAGWKVISAPDNRLRLRRRTD